MSYNEYRNEVRRIFKGCMPSLSDGEIDDYFNSIETEEIIRSEYKSYQTSIFHATSPSGTASALYMLY